MNKSYHKLIVTILILITLLFTTNGIIGEKNTAKADTNSSWEFVKELTSEKYNGRQTGTEGYEKAVEYISTKLKENGVIPLLDKNTYRQEYSIIKASFAKQPVFTVNNKKLEFMVDYMPFARCSSVTNLNIENIYYAGIGLEKDYSQNVEGNIVIIKWNNQNGKFGGGILDRVQIAKAHGAKCVLIVANGELEVGNYEHPLNGDDCGLPVLYISKNVAKTIFNVPDNDESKKLTSNETEISLNIERKKAKGSNLIGVIPGKREDKAVLIATNLDGFGSLPDGRVYESAKSSAAGIGTLIDLAQYYQENKPDYTIILAFAGSKWTGNDGIEELCKVLDFNSIAFTLDLYAMGGSSKLSLNYTEQNTKGLAEAIKEKIGSQLIYNNNDFGNALSSILSTKTKKLFLLRDGDTWISNSFEDKFDGINKDNYLKGISYIKTTIDNVINNDQSDNNSFSYDDTNIKSTYFSEVNKDIKYKESKYFKVYFDQELETQMNNAYLKEVDNIYERIAKFNYYPYIGEKVMLLNLKNGNDAALIAKRNDLIGKSENAGGGFASMVNATIYCRQVSYGTVAHELNHLLAAYKKFGSIESGGFKNSVAQESQGQSFLVTYNNQTYVTDKNVLINQKLCDEEAPDVIKIAENYNKLLDWNAYIKPGNDYKGKWQNTYHVLGSIYTYMKYVYGDNATRRAMYRIYELQPAQYINYRNVFVEDLDLSIDDFLNGWSIWMTSSGNDTGNKVKTYVGKYSDKLLQHDYEKIYTVIAGSSDNGSSGTINDNPSQSASVDLDKVPVIKSKQSKMFAYKDDKNKYLSINYTSGLNDSQYKISNVGVAIDKDNIYFKIKYYLPVRAKPLVFLQGDAPGLKEFGNYLESGDNVIIIKISKKSAKQFSAGIAVNLGERNFIFIDKAIIDSLLNIEMK